MTATRKTLLNQALYLSLFTIAYNLVEGVVSIAFGIADESVSLAGFGGDSLVEVGSAFLVLWRVNSERSGGSRLPVEVERRATFGIGVLFILLALITVFASTLVLYSGSRPETTVPGLVISLLSLSFMYFLWAAKVRVGKSLDSATVIKDAACSLACIKLSFVLLAGSLVYLLFPALWWVDSLAALGLAIIIGKEGIETIQASRNENFVGGCGCTGTKS